MYPLRIKLIHKATDSGEGLELFCRERARARKRAHTRETLTIQGFYPSCTFRCTSTFTVKQVVEQ